MHACGNGHAPVDAAPRLDGRAPTDAVRLLRTARKVAAEGGVASGVNGKSLQVGKL